MAQKAEPKNQNEDLLSLPPQMIPLRPLNTGPKRGFKKNRKEQTKEINQKPQKKQKPKETKKSKEINQSKANQSKHPQKPPTSHSFPNGPLLPTAAEARFRALGWQKGGSRGAPSAKGGEAKAELGVRLGDRASKRGLVFPRVSTVFSRVSMVFPRVSMVFPRVSMVFPRVSMVFPRVSMVFPRVSMVFPRVSSEKPASWSS